MVMLSFSRANAGGVDVDFSLSFSRTSAIGWVYIIDTLWHRIISLVITQLLLLRLQEQSQSSLPINLITASNSYYPIATA